LIFSFWFLDRNGTGDLIKARGKINQYAHYPSFQSCQAKAAGHLPQKAKAPTTATAVRSIKESAHGRTA